MKTLQLFFRAKYGSKKGNTSLRIIDSKAELWKPALLLLPSILIILLFTIVPFVLTVIESFRVADEFAETIDDYSYGLGNYALLFDEDNGIGTEFKVALRNSILYSVFSLPISLTISILVSSAIFHIVNKHTRGLVQTVFFLPYVTNAIAVGSTFFFLFGGTGESKGLVNLVFGSEIRWLKSGDKESIYPLTVIIARGVWGNLAFQILILTSAMLGVNKQLYKSASIDGAYKAKQFFLITLPSIKKTISFLITVGLIGGIKVFPLAVFNNNADVAVNNGGSSIMLLIYRYVQRADYAKAAALSACLVILGVSVSYTLRKLVYLLFLYAGKRGVKRVQKQIANKANLS
ncbi:carbohydrate ABC transporter permease [Mycoplasma sp. Ms02]|uniref:carbohydrate ABC transporter permease n=1 Tax=Mycoplasma sp. Ms02 TaxID=353851 RepID=UPI001C8A52C1|nr:sugar ABC transporter permease [Mycoplasma sp. Ms02]QZE12225.1 sugar ABC transporter permease [Mycoplasma sp. Ms02]